MSSVAVRKVDGEWPDLTQFTGEEVRSVEPGQSDAGLALTFQSGDVLLVPAPWQFSSCLLALSSAQIDATNAGPESITDLVGLCGASLTSLESDQNHLDLIFGSIRISITQIPQTKL